MAILIYCAHHTPSLTHPQVTYADFAVYHLIEYAADRGVDVSGDRYPALLRLKASVEGLPNITKWLHERKA